MKLEDFRRFDRDKHTWLTPEVPTAELMEQNPGYMIRRIHDPKVIREVIRRQLIDVTLHGMGAQSYEDLAPGDAKRVALLMTDIEKAAESSVEKIVWAVQNQTKDIIKIFDVNEIIKLSGADAEAFQKLYLQGLATFPWAFGSTFAVESKKGLDQVARWIEERDVYGIYHKDYKHNKRIKMVGVGRLERKEGAMEHEGYMGTLFVDAEYWGNKFGDALTKHRLDRAMELGLASVEITVTSTNKFVLEYYKKLGFIKRGERTGIIGGKSYPWTDLWLPMEIWRKRRVKEKQSPTGVSSTPLPNP